MKSQMVEISQRMYWRGFMCGELHACRKGTGFTDTLLPEDSFENFEFPKSETLPAFNWSGGRRPLRRLPLHSWAEFSQKTNKHLAMTGRRYRREGLGSKLSNLIWNCATQNTKQTKIKRKFVRKVTAWKGLCEAKCVRRFSNETKFIDHKSKSVCNWTRGSEYWGKCNLGNWNCERDAIGGAIESGEMQSQWDWLLNATLVLTQPPPARTNG